MGEQGQVDEPGNPGIVLSVLTSIERDSAITQRKLARELGIALGLANAYLRRCVRKGLVKMRQVPLNRYAYYLTPQGLCREEPLDGRISGRVARFLSPRAQRLRGFVSPMRGARLANVALYGAGDLAEIAVLSAGETAVEVLCVIDPDAAGRRCGGLAMVPDLDDGLARGGARAARRHHRDRHASTAGELRRLCCRRSELNGLTAPAASSRRACCASRRSRRRQSKRRRHD